MEQNRLFTLKDPKSIISESFRTLRTNMQFSNIDKDIKTIVVTSSSPGEGKTEIEAAKNGKALLDKVHANLIGAVLNKIPVNENLIRMLR